MRSARNCRGAAYPLFNNAVREVTPCTRESFGARMVRHRPAGGREFGVGEVDELAAYPRAASQGGSMQCVVGYEPVWPGDRRRLRWLRVSAGLIRQKCRL
jgi:hypothetical protein